VSYCCELADAALNLQVRVVVVLASAHSCWLVTRVALWNALCGTTRAVGAGFRLRAGLRFCHDSYNGDSGDTARGFSAQKGQQTEFLSRVHGGYYFGVGGYAV